MTQLSLFFFEKVEFIDGFDLLRKSWEEEVEIRTVYELFDSVMDLGSGKSLWAVMVFRVAMAGELTQVPVPVPLN